LELDGVLLEPGGHRVEDYFIPGDLTDVDDAVAAATRRLHMRQAGHCIPEPHSGTTPTIGSTSNITKTRCAVTRRQRIDLALLLIVRRAERDATVRGQSPVAQPDALTATPSPSTPSS